MSETRLAGRYVLHTFMAVHDSKSIWTRLALFVTIRDFFAVQLTSMIEQTERTIPVAVWVQSIDDAKSPMFYNGFICDKSADVRASSSDRKFTMELSTNALSREHLDKFQWFSRYGFTVIEVPDYWVDEYRRPHGWRDHVINGALNRATLRQDQNESVTAAVYDSELAHEVLTILNESFPYGVSMIEIKRSLAEEPTDDVLLTALDALLLEGQIDGSLIRDRGRKLMAIAEIKITSQGHKEMTGVHHPAVVYGDQNINYGHAGAIGRHSIGVINYQQQWETVQNQVDLSALAIQLEQVIKQQSQSASSSSDFQQLSLLAEAKEHAERREGSKLMETIAKIGQSALPVLAKAGAEGLVQWIEHKLGAKL